MGEQEKVVVQLLAYAYLRNARPEKAAALLAALDAVAPGQRKVLRALALAQVRCGQPQLALDTLDRVAIAGDVDAAFHLLRARALAACERRIEAGAAMAHCLAMRRAAAGGAGMGLAREPETTVHSGARTAVLSTEVPQ